MKTDEIKRKDLRTARECWGSDRKTCLEEGQRRVRVTKVLRGIKFDGRNRHSGVIGPDPLTIDALRLA